MNSYQIHSILKSIASKTYPEHNIKPFFVEIHSKEMKTFHGDYFPKDRKIRIFNLSRSTTYTIGTAIHELAHHCQYSIYGNTDHSKQFYQVLYDLLVISIQMGLVNYEELRKKKDSRDIEMLEKYYGKINAQYIPEMDKRSDLAVVKVFNSFSIKDTLKSNDYFYNKNDQSWSKEISLSELEREESFLSNLTSPHNIQIEKGNDFTINGIHYIVILKNTPHSDNLKSNGYLFNVYKIKKESWIKKIQSNEIENEKKYLHTLGIHHYKIH